MKILLTAITAVLLFTISSPSFASDEVKIRINDGKVTAWSVPKIAWEHTIPKDVPGECVQKAVKERPHTYVCVVKNFSELRHGLPITSQYVKKETRISFSKDTGFHTKVVTSGYIKTNNWYLTAFMYVPPILLLVMFAIVSSTIGIYVSAALFSVTGVVAGSYLGMLGGIEYVMSTMLIGLIVHTLGIVRAHTAPNDGFLNSDRTPFVMGMIIVIAGAFFNAFIYATSSKFGWTFTEVTHYVFLLICMMAAVGILIFVSKRLHFRTASQ